MLRDLIKTATFASLHFTVGFGVAYLISGSLPVALGVAMIEPAVNTVVFFLHERVWQRIGNPEPGRSGGPRVEDHHDFSMLRRLVQAG
ncbi:DUF2061 domain-containing protein [Dongia sp.]|uniref:DUF2061 domain-containing protein n=1 Tax=Dongia sp. TaxID=1977262 RepID=UPI0035AF175B